MIFYKIICIVLSSNVLLTASVEAVLMAPESRSPEVGILIDAPSHLDNLKVKHPTPPSSLVVETSFHSDPSDDHLSAGFFSILLTSLAYTMDFTSQGRLYTSVPLAFKEMNDELISFRFLPHPEMLQSTVLPKNSILFTAQKNTPKSQPEEVSTLGPAVWFGILLLLLLVITGSILWRSKTKTVLRL